MINSNYQISVVIPTYNRGEVLLNTLQYLFQQVVKPYAIIVVDQTDYHECDEVYQQLVQLSDTDKINWIRLAEPSIPHAMNQGLLAATSSHVLFLDDDIKIANTFIENHLRALHEHGCPAHVGQIIQPWQQPEDNSNHGTQSFLSSDLRQDLDFPFNSTKVARIYNCMAGNLCVDRLLAIHTGGFDERFTGSAYRFETEFCRRLCRAQKKAFAFVPSASLDHLHLSSGGTRSKANHLTSTLPNHSAGDYYFVLREGQGLSGLKYIIKRLLGSVVAKFYMLKPWWIPVRLFAEMRGMLCAYRYYQQGPIYIRDDVEN